MVGNYSRKNDLQEVEEPEPVLQESPRVPIFQNLNVSWPQWV